LVAQLQTPALAGSQAQVASAALRRLTLSLAVQLSEWASGARPGSPPTPDAEAGGAAGAAAHEVVREIRRNLAPAPGVQTVFLAPAPTRVAQVVTVAEAASLRDLVPGLDVDARLPQGVSRAVATRVTMQVRRVRGQDGSDVLTRIAALNAVNDLMTRSPEGGRAAVVPEALVPAAEALRGAVARNTAAPDVPGPSTPLPFTWLARSVREGSPSERVEHPGQADIAQPPKDSQQPGERRPSHPVELVFR
jgi:hypothetical protein